MSKQWTEYPSSPRAPGDASLCPCAHWTRSWSKVPEKAFLAGGRKLPHAEGCDGNGFNGGLSQAQTLFVALSDLFRDYREDYRRILTDMGSTYYDPLEGARLRREGDKILLTYGGDGYFEPKLRQQVSELASKFGYKAEDNRSWRIELCPE